MERMVDSLTNPLIHKRIPRLLIIISLDRVVIFLPTNVSSSAFHRASWPSLLCQTGTPVSYVSQLLLHDLVASTITIRKENISSVETCRPQLYRCWSSAMKTKKGNTARTQTVVQSINSPCTSYNSLTLVHAVAH